ncbi:histidine kinase [Niastella caeni]|uniref:Histidine kinase n=1 Tax=Niastella caeni TaxID=2569763 RepID=A0A4V6T3N9_9BACT|nr:histidine kinase [Niastella caeni]THU34876.1 histidine kinase [Niastella caeni]
MYRIFLLAIICMACNTNGKKKQQPASGHFMAFLKNNINPLLQNREAKAAKRKLDSILPLIEQRDNYVEMCSWLRCMAVVYQIESKPALARQYANKALKLAIEKDTTERQILAGKIQKAAVLTDIRLLDSALGYAREAYSMAERIDTPGLPFICLKLYDIYEKIGDLEMQKKYLFEGFKRSTSPKHKTVFAANIAAWYERVDQIDSALIFFQALMKDSSFSNPYYDAVRYETLGTLLSKKGNCKEGLGYQLKGMQISRGLGEVNAESYFNIAATYRKLGQYKKDENLLDTALSYVSHEKNWALTSKIWRAKADNWALQKKYSLANAAMASAFRYFKREVDSSAIGRARELEAKYSLLEKDNEIISLALSNQESEMTRERQMRAIIRISSGVAILGIFVFWMWRRKQLKMNIREESLRQQLLRGQIDSHFLYNSVFELQKLIRKGTTEVSVEFAERLVQLFRLSLENARQPFVPLKNELDALASYLMLQQSLFANQFEYRIEVEGIADQEIILIPPMLLQPFTENAIMHGFTGQQEKGQINISIQKNHKALHCIIEDNGRGFQVAGNQSQKRSLSTIINKERLEILSRQTRTLAQLKIIDKKATTGEAGVRVELILPYQTKHKTPFVPR